MVKLEYFGPSKDFTLKESESVKSISTLIDLYQYLGRSYSTDFEQYVQENCGITLNFEYIDQESPEKIRFEEDDEICIIPPVSSG